MGKRKSDSELVRFVWKRNAKYDFMLLSEVETRNPFAFKNSKPVWDEIAKYLQECSLKMKVSCRSCRERVTELLKAHRQKESQSKAASGVEEPEMTEVEILLTSIAKLQDGGYDKQVNAVYRTDDKSDADAIRATALLAVHESDDDSSSVEIVINTSDATESNHKIDEENVSATTDSDYDDPNVQNASILTESSSIENFPDTFNAAGPSNIINQNVAATSNARPNPTTINSNSGGSKSLSVMYRNADTRSCNIFFNDDEDDDHEDPSEKLLAKNSSSGTNNPKKDLVRYLEKKSMGELLIRKEEIGIKKEELKFRDKERKEAIEIRKDELKIREMEVVIKAKEVENKSKELEILLKKSEAEADNQKRITDLLLTLVANRN